MTEDKKWWKSLTIVSQIGIIICVILMLTNRVKPLKYEFTTEELCNWAYTVSNNDLLTIIGFIAVTLAFAGIYGRKRAKKEIK